MTFESLPEEIFHIILRSCSRKDILQLSSCNRFLYNATKAARWKTFTYREGKANWKLDSDSGQYVKKLRLVHCTLSRSNQKLLSSYTFGLGELLSLVNPDQLQVINSFPDNFCLDKMVASLDHLTFLELKSVSLDDWSPLNSLGGLITLRLAWCTIADKSLAAMLDSNDHLAEMTIYMCPNLTDKWHSMIGLKTKLHTLAHR